MQGACHTTNAPLSVDHAHATSPQRQSRATFRLRQTSRIARAANRATLRGLQRIRRALERFNCGPEAPLCVHTRRAQPWCRCVCTRARAPASRALSTLSTSSLFDRSVEELDASFRSGAEAAAARASRVTRRTRLTRACTTQRRWRRYASPPRCPTTRPSSSIGTITSAARAARFAPRSCPVSATLAD